ncbi:hypothetical protein [Mucilaginibacter flavus]|uniref:hypothetical protein n=1 Tax=Mucilaginibacter flavus TaxID=931504 RepID=UPI0025B318A5|nr:hypothetical protein [Mucilaginibacter flavus]MDN3581369.1 hypothetical protein [Mucilaginibacter flavus]
MSKSFLIVLFAFLFLNSFCKAQKLYIWCPTEQDAKPRTDFLENENVNIVVFDGRIIPKNSKIECESSSVDQALVEYIKKAYPSCKITTLNESDYYKKSEAGKITIKIGIAAYQAGFGTDISVGIGSVGGKFSYGIFPKGEWNGLTSYFVQIFDNRKVERKKYNKEINEVTSKSNMWGYKTARTCLFSSYDKANQTLLSFIESSFME